jgi:hypothetical protein
MRVTHEERGITVISGDPGIGKTSAIDAFAREFEDQCLVVKIESPATSRGIKNLRMLQLVIEALKKKRGCYVGEYLGNTPWVLKQKIETLLSDWSTDFGPDAPWPPTFTLTGSNRAPPLLERPGPLQHAVSGRADIRG